MEGEATKKGCDIKSITPVGTCSFVLPGLLGTLTECSPQSHPMGKVREVFTCDSHRPWVKGCGWEGGSLPSLSLLPGGQSRQKRALLHTACWGAYSSSVGGSLTR